MNCFFLHHFGYN